MALKWFGDPSRARSCVVIPNGVPIQSRAAAASGIGAQLKREHDEIFVCSANWHPQKRLADNIELFRHVRKDPRGSCLIVLGNHPDVLVRAKQDDRVFYGGSLSHQDSLALYAIADWMIHLAWLDHCPNTVVEALSVGTPVVCTGAGGTIELLRDHTGEIARGASIAERQHDLSLADYDSPPCIGALIESFGNLRSPPAFSTAEFDIAFCAQKYADLLAEVL
jgi:glycosyltransferase involved in cell wall biosynthesis